MMPGTGFAEIVAIAFVALVSLSFQVFVVVLGVVVAWRWLHRPKGFATAMARSRDKSAFEILDERYARGEIDEREFDERQARLTRQYQQVP